MEVELIKKKKKRSKSLVIGILSVLVVTIGISYGLFKYSRVADNQELIAGDIYMKAISNEVTVGNIKPMDKEEGKTNGNKYKFKVEGYNDSKKDIYYGIYLKYGEEQTGKERFKDEDIVVYLTETKDGETKDVFGPGRLSDFNRNMIYTNTISGNISKEEKVEIEYELTVWLSDNVLVSDTETSFEGKHIYTTSEYENSYFNIDVEVEGDFVEKEIIKGETSIEAYTVESNKDYDLESAPVVREEVEVIIKSDKETNEMVVTDETTSEVDNIEPIEKNGIWEGHYIAESTGKYNYYVVYTDGKISPRENFSIKIEYKYITKPNNKLCIARTYNGEEQEIISNKEGYTFENNKQKDAGSYQVTVKLKTGYRWNDESKTEVKFNCSIGKKDLIVIPDSNQSKVYGSEEKDLTYTYEGNIEEPGFIGKLGRTPGNDVGRYTINKGTLDIEDKLPFKASNYNLKLSETPVNFEIIKATPKLTLSSETGEVLAGKSVTITGTVSPSIGGTYTVTTSKEGIVTTKVNGNEITITGVANGSVDVVVTFNPTDTKNYNKSNSATYKVSGYKIASEATCSNPTYNGASQALASGGTGITLGNNSGVDAKDNYSVTESLQEGYRWSDNTIGNKTLTCKINKKNASITANNQTVTYGTGITNAVSQATAKDLVTNHTLGSVTLTASTKDVPGGKITPSNAKIMSGETEVTANYSLSYADGTLTINKKQITVTPNSNLSKTYGDAEPTIGYSNSGAISGENPVFSGKLGRTTGENVGTYPVNLGNLTLSDGEGFKANNYSLALASGTFNFTINQRETTITPVNQTITYGGSIDTSVSKATASNLVSGHSLSQVTLATTDVNVTTSGKISASGAKIVNGSTDVTSNYKISYGTGTLTINKANVEPGSCANKTYNGGEQTIVNTVGGVNYTATKGIDANTYNITATPDSNHKFSDNAANKTLSCSIAKKTATVTWPAPGTYTYNGSGQGPTPTVASGVNNETINLTVNKPTNAGSNLKTTISIANVSGGRANANNYTLSSTESTTYNIAKATPSLNLSATSGSVNKDSKITFTENSNVKGKFSNVSSLTGVATVSPGTIGEIAANTNQTVTITGAGSGQANINITFTPTDTTNYNNKTGTYNVTGYLVASTGSCQARTYNGGSQTLMSGGVGVSYVNNERTQAGSQNVTINANSGYRFSDNTTSKIQNCSIAKANPVVTLTPTTGTILAGTSTTFKEKANIKGKFGNVSNATGVATVSPGTTGDINPNTDQVVTVTGTGKGETNIAVTFTPSDTTNYNNKTENYKIIVNLVDYKINYYLMRQDKRNYDLGKTVTKSGKVGENVTGELLTFDNQQAPTSKSKVLTANASENVIDYYYTRTCYGAMCEYLARDKKFGEGLYNKRTELGLYESGLSGDTSKQTVRYTGTTTSQPENYVCYGSPSRDDCFKRYYPTYTLVEDGIYCDGIDDFISFGYANYNFYNHVSLILRVKFHSYTTVEQQTVLGNQQGKGFGFSLISNIIHVQMHINGTWLSLYSNSTIDLEKYYTLAAIYDGTQIRLYINGVLDNYLNCSGNIGIPTKNTVLALCTNPYQNTYGNLQEANVTVNKVFVYTDAITPDEITRYFSGEILDYPSDNAIVTPETIEYFNNNLPYTPNNYLHRVVGVYETNHQARLMRNISPGASTFAGATAVNYDASTLKTAVNNNSGLYTTSNISDGVTWYDAINNTSHGTVTLNNLNTLSANDILNKENGNNSTNKLWPLTTSDLLLSTRNNGLKFVNDYGTIATSWLYAPQEWGYHKWDNNYGYYISETGALCGYTGAETANYTQNCGTGANGYFGNAKGYRLFFNTNENLVFCGGSGTNLDPMIIGYKKCVW